MSHIYLQYMVEGITFSNFSANWTTFDFRMFSGAKTLWDYQQPENYPRQSRFCLTNLRLEGAHCEYPMLVIVKKMSLANPANRLRQQYPVTGLSLR